jgi:hypothetical protein
MNKKSDIHIREFYIDEETFNKLYKLVDHKIYDNIHQVIELAIKRFVEEIKIS